MAWTTSYYHYDGLGSTDRLTNSAQTVTDSYVNDAFGNSRTSAGSTTNPFRWVGRLGYYYQAELGEYYLRARTYDPRTARFLTPDLLKPFGNWRSAYIYVFNAPLLLFDPSGLCPCEVVEFVLIKSPDDVPKDVMGVTFTNPHGVGYDLNVPGPVNPPNGTGTFSNVVWVLVRVKNIEDCEFRRYVTGTFILDGQTLDKTTSRDLPPEPQSEDEPVTAETKYIDTRGTGIANRELFTGQDFVVVSDAAGVGPTIERRIKNSERNEDDIDVDFKWYFLIGVLSKSMRKSVGTFRYDVQLQGTVTEGKLVGLHAMGEPINAASQPVED